MNKTFRTFWETFNKTDDKLSRDQLYRVRRKLSKLDGQKKTYSQKVDTLARTVPKLREPWKAERVVNTESKRSEMKSVIEDSNELGFDKYKILTGPNACKSCKDLSQNGTKIYSTKDIEKRGSPIIPHHPNCFCIILPAD
jgi:hypothetical protein